MCVSWCIVAEKESLRGSLRRNAPAGYVQTERGWSHGRLRISSVCPWDHLKGKRNLPNPALARYGTPPSAPLMDGLVSHCHHLYANFNLCALLRTAAPSPPPAPPSPLPAAAATAALRVQDWNRTLWPWLSPLRVRAYPVPGADHARTGEVPHRSSQHAARGNSGSVLKDRRHRGAFYAWIWQLLTGLDLSRMVRCT